MIVTVTMNPAVDQTLVLQKFVAGDTLRVKSSRFDPGGKVAYEVHDSGVSTVLATRGCHGTAAVLTPGAEFCHRREVDILYPGVRVEPIAEAVSSRN